LRCNLKKLLDPSDHPVALFATVEIDKLAESKVDPAERETGVVYAILLFPDRIPDPYWLAACDRAATAARRRRRCHCLWRVATTLVQRSFELIHPVLRESQRTVWLPRIIRGREAEPSDLVLNFDRPIRGAARALAYDGCDLVIVGHRCCGGVAQAPHETLVPSGRGRGVVPRIDDPPNDIPGAREKSDVDPLRVLEYYQY
jgi:hypothetical protein